MITGAVPELGYLCFDFAYDSAQHVRPFNSEVHSASALLPCLHHILQGSLEIALKRTRPRQRFFIMLARLYDGGKKESRMNFEE